MCRYYYTCIVFKGLTCASFGEIDIDPVFTVYITIGLLGFDPSLVPISELPRHALSESD